MKRIVVVMAGLLLLAALAFSPSGPALFAAQSNQQASGTPTPAPEAEATDIPVAEEDAAAAAADESEAEPTLADLSARIESLEATVAELHAAHEAAHAATYDDVNSVNVAIYLLDAAGMHELETRLVSEGEILPGDSGQVGQIARVLSTVAWPEELAADATALQEMLANLSAALADDDLETVQPLSTEAHVAYHVFSHNAQMWIAEASVAEMAAAPGQSNRVNTALYLLDGAGLHGIAKRLSEDEEILPGDSGQVGQVARLLSTVDWPQELTADAAALHETLIALAAALADDDLETATALADAAHDAQHDFSHAAQAWLSAGAMDAHHDDMSHDDMDHSDMDHGDMDHSEMENQDEAPAEHTHDG